MSDFDKKMRECREAKKLSQNEFAKLIEAHHSIIGKYERGEVKPSIEIVLKIATVLDTTVGYLLGETQDLDIMKDKGMLKRFNDIASFSDEEKNAILWTIDAMIDSVKLKKLTA